MALVAVWFKFLLIGGLLGDDGWHDVPEKTLHAEQYTILSKAYLIQQMAHSPFIL